jgi:hypothetical protein
MEILAWIGGITALANMVKAWMDARKAGLDLTQAKQKVQEQAKPAAKKTRPKKAQAAVNLVIQPTLLEELVRDINSAAERFSSVFNDPRYTPADIDREQERAKLTVCTHIKRIREFNDGVLPNDELGKIARSFQCDNA